MATSVQQPSPQFQPQAIPKKLPVIPVKAAFFGETGSGKTTSAALLAAALSKEHHGGASVWVTDPELGWQFPKRVIFGTERIELVQRTVPTFKAMMQDMRDAERAGACVYAVELSKIWIELLKTVRKDCGDNWGNQLNSMWTDYVAHFLNSKLHCLALGRVGSVEEEVRDDDGKLHKEKIRDKMKAGGSNDFGYEPHLVLRMTLEKKARRRGGELREGEGRMIHRADVLKDRTWALNGNVIRWSDKGKYKPGGYTQVWNSLRPHFLEVQEAMGVATLDMSASSSSLIDRDGNSEWYQLRERKAAISAEIKACLDLSFGGRGKDDVQVRLAVTDLIFGVKSKEAADALPLEQLERGLRILHAYEKFPKHNLESKEAVLNQIAEAIAEYDRGQSEEWDIPF